jgi:hypothetical protein
MPDGIFLREPGREVTTIPLVFRSRLRLAAEEGIVLGVKWGIVLLLLATALNLFIADYAVTRQNAAFASDYLKRVIAQQEAAKVAAPK